MFNFLKRKYFLFFLLLSVSGFSQKNNIDSLRKVLQQLNQTPSPSGSLPAAGRGRGGLDTAKALALKNLAYELSAKQSDSALVYAEKALTLAQKANAQNIIAYIYNTFGIIYENKSDYNKALEYYDKALKIFGAMNDKQGLAAVYTPQSNTFRYLGNYSRSLECNIKALKIRDELSDKKNTAANYNNIGLVYNAQGNYSKALENFLKAAQLYEEFHEKSVSISNTLNNIGLVYYNLDNYPKAMEFLSQSLSIDKEIGNKDGMATKYNNMAVIYMDQKKYQKALENFNNALQIFQELGNKSNECAVLLGIAYLNIERSYYKQAEEALLHAKVLAEESGDKDNLKATYLHFSWLYDSTRQYKLAYEYHKRYSEIKDTLLNEESSKQIAEMQTKYETEKKEQQITLLNKDKEIQNADLKRQKIIIWSVVSGLLLVVVLSLFIFRERKKSEKLLLNILPAETAKELKRKGKATPRYYESVTVMFTDFKGFTQIAEKLSAEELVNELDFLFKKFDEIISKYQIEKIKTIGDAYMCVSGLPTPNSNHAENIIKAALEIQQFVSSPISLRQGGGTKGEEPPPLGGGLGWGLRIGIHTGPVTAGVVGDKKFAYDIWGDTVNTASRMESSGEAGKVNISEATHLLLTSSKGGGTVPASLSLSPLERVGKEVERWKFIYRGEVEAKHKGKIKMYFVEKQNS